jgi:tetratricopeptide (TPR) repeat protein
MPNSIRLFIVFVAVLALARGTKADDESWVGKNVMCKKVDLELRIKEDNQWKVADKIHDFIITVEKEDGPWIRVCTSRGSGWIAKKDAILLENAIGYWTDRIKAIDKDADSYCMRGIAYMKKGDLDNAINDFGDAIRLDSKDPAFWCNRGAAHYHNQNYADAIADYDEAIRLAPKYTNLFVVRGLAYMAQRAYSKAVADFDEAIRLDPKNTYAYVDRACAFNDIHEYSKAIADCDEAIRLDPKDTYAYINRANAYLRKHDYTRAAADCDEAIRLDPKSAPAYHRRSWIMATCPDAELRDGKRAVEFGKRACELSDWKDPQTLNALAAAYAEAGDFNEAIRWVKKALEFPAFEKAYGDTAREELELFENRKPYRYEIAQYETAPQ